MRIAIVNDMVMAIEAMRRVLARAPRDRVAWIARDGAEAVELCATDTPDLILMDLIMPVMIVSYKDREEDRLRGLEAGADYYLTKASFQDDTLLNAAADLIGEPVA